MFNGVTYLGCATVNAPRSEVEIYRNMAVLNEQSQSAIPVVLSVPSTADGTVRLDFGFFFYFYFYFFLAIKHFCVLEPSIHTIQITLFLFYC